MVQWLSWALLYPLFISLSGRHLQKHGSLKAQLPNAWMFGKVLLVFIPS
jgi:hypothetical protein